MADKRLFLLDAFALIFRAYYALIKNPRLTSKGRNTNAQFVFTNTLIDLLNTQKPTHMGVCFDTAAPTGRHTDFEEYKSNRQETPEDILSAIPDVKRILRAFNIPILEVDGYEADDVIGTLSKQAAQVGYEVFMVTPDKDFGQLVSDSVKIYRPGYQGGDPEILGANEVCEKWGVQSVDQVVDILGLMGDAVDNIPGIPGVGPKTATKLLAEHGTLEKVLDNAESIKGSLGEKIRAGKEAALLSKKLATIITNVPVEFHEENFRVKEWNKEKLKEVFVELEFKAVGKRILGDEFGFSPGPQQGVQTDLFSKPAQSTNGKLDQAIKKTKEVEDEIKDVVTRVDKNIHNCAHDYRLLEGEEAITQLVKQLGGYHEICFGAETTNTDANDAELIGLSFAVKDCEGFYISCPTDQNRTKEILAHFAPLFADENKLWVGQNLKHDLLALKWYGIDFKGKIFDTMLAHYVIEPDGRGSVDTMSTKYLGYEPTSIEDLIGKKGRSQGNIRDVELEKIKEYAVEDADITLQLKKALIPLLKKHQVEKVFTEVENPLVTVLTDMEYEGVKIDVNFLNDYSKELEREARNSEEAVYKQAGVRFNLSSPRQLSEVLFEKLCLDPKAKKTKTGQYATGEDVLMKLAHGNQICMDILAYREYTKLKSTYVDALPQLINRKTGRVHTTYGQAVAVTGRLASNNPNLQNIPIRSDRGKEIRKAFIPRDKNHILLSADYSQIELRIVAAISGDPNMCEAFRKNTDIHTATASKVYSVAEAGVTKEMRYKAKSVNFGIIYGQGAFGLADNLGISRTEAKAIIDNYKKEFHGITRYMDDTINFAREHGYVQTLMGRKRWLRDINSANFTVRSFAERNAINSPIQGTAADMIKLAMIKVYDEIKRRNFKSKMILQVHDELVFDALKEEAEDIKPVIVECMQAAMTLPNGVPVIAEVGAGENWLEAH